MPIVYSITSPSGKIYIGATKQSMMKRKSAHKTHYNKWKAGCKQSYTTASILFDEGFELCVWNILEECDEDVFHIRERYWMESFPCVNKNNPAGTRTEEDIIESNRKRKRAYRLRQKAKAQPEPETAS